jgi:hypothetical protein
MQFAENRRPNIFRPFLLEISMHKISALALACLLSSGVAFADSNVALNKSVTLSGTGFGIGWGGGLADASSLTDGVFKDAGHTWDNDTLYWSGLDAVSVIDLDGMFTINAFTVQTDNNDTYRIEYNQNGSWTTAWDVPTNCCYGMQTNSTTLASAIVTDSLRFTATGGDGLYSVSEIQAFGQPVPEPETYALMLAGLGLVGFAARRRKI